MIRSAVDLPQPEGPSRLTNSPRPTSSDMSFSASVPFEKVLEIARSETSGCPRSETPAQRLGRRGRSAARWQSASRTFLVL